MYLVVGHRFSSRGSLRTSVTAFMFAAVGLRRQHALETGGVLVGDEVRVVADIAAVCTTPDADGAA